MRYILLLRKPHITGVKLLKQNFFWSIAEAVSVLDAVISRGLTFETYKSTSEQLRAYLVSGDFNKC